MKNTGYFAVGFAVATLFWLAVTSYIGIAIGQVVAEAKASCPQETMECP